jgi:hypothetical protein
MVLHPLQRQSARGDRGAQRHMEGTTPQGRLQLRGGDVRDRRDVGVLCGVPHGGAFL